MSPVRTAVFLLALYVALGICFFRINVGPWTATRALGLAIAVPSFALWGLARWQLGKSFAVRAQAKELVTHGLYSRIRNPIYLFGSFAILGTLLYVGRPIFLLLFLILVPLQWARIRREEQVLEEKFGEAYRAYKRMTWF